jgi:hypothetical protein
LADSVEVVWTDGFTGVDVRLAQHEDSLVGVATAFSDVSPRGVATAAALAIRAPCRLVASVPSIDSVLATLDAYAEKRISALAAAKVVVDYLAGTNQSLNVQMDAELRDAVSRELKARGPS